MIFLDTNVLASVLARLMESHHIHQRPAADAIRYLVTRQHLRVFISPQVVIEFYAVSTRASNNLKFTPERALAEIENIKKSFSLLPETPGLFERWEELTVKYKPTNRRVFDVRHVAFMLVHNIPRILTFNDQDFTPFVEIQVLNPFDVLGIPRV